MTTPIGNSTLVPYIKQGSMYALTTPSIVLLCTLLFLVLTCHIHAGQKLLAQPLTTRQPDAEVRLTWTSVHCTDLLCKLPWHIQEQRIHEQSESNPQAHKLTRCTICVQH